LPLTLEIERYGLGKCLVPLEVPHGNCARGHRFGIGLAGYGTNFRGFTYDREVEE